MLLKSEYVPTALNDWDVTVNLYFASTDKCTNVVSTSLLMSNRAFLRSLDLEIEFKSNTVQEYSD